VYVVVIYDISSNESRQRLAEYLKGKGFTRIQRSAFIGRPPSSILVDVERVIPRYISGSDVVHLIPLLEYSVKGMKVYGKPLSQLTPRQSIEVVV